MSRRSLDWFRRPELILADLIREAGRGRDADRTIRRALVLAVDHEGGKLQNPSGSGTFTSAWPGQDPQTLKAVIGPSNPRGSIKARILTDGEDRLRTDDELRVFWPMWPVDQIGIPVVPGEHVFVMFEGAGLENGFWLSRVGGHESAGAYIGNKSYTSLSAPGSAMDYFEPNPVKHDTSERHASLAPGKSAIDHFEDE